jgi:hypothetical protein
VSVVSESGRSVSRIDIGRGSVTPDEQPIKLTFIAMMNAVNVILQLLPREGLYQINASEFIRLKEQRLLLFFLINSTNYERNTQHHDLFLDAEKLDANRIL